MNKIRTENRGFTLLESLIALLVLAAGLLGLAQLFVFAVMQNSYGRQNTMAASVAASQLENLKNQFNNDLRNGVPSIDMTAGDHGPVQAQLQPPTNSNQGTFIFNVSWTVALAGSEKDVTVTVTPGSSNVSMNRPIQLSSHFAP